MKIIEKKLALALTAMLVLSLGFGVMTMAGCSTDDGLGDTIEDAADDAGDAIEDAGDEVEDAADDLGDH